MSENKRGVLYVVSTPIGHLDDMTFRAVEVLKAVDKIAVEDTRHSAPLLKHFAIKKPMLSMHEFNERERLSIVIDLLEEGESVALISDAGTPLISDPGFHLVREAKKRDYQVVPIPGACAAIAALSVSGLPTDRFVFEGFLPNKNEARKNRLKQLFHERRTLIFYEAPHRLLDTLISMQEVLGDERPIVVARELTKFHESVLATTARELVEYYKSHENEQRGEVVILVHGLNEEESESKAVVPERVLEVLMEELPLKQAASLASRITGERKNVLYDLGLGKKTV